MSSPSQTSATTVTQPWGPAQPFLKKGFQSAGNIYNNPAQQHPNANMNTSYDLANSQATNNPLLSTANAQTQNIMNGANMSPSSNPYLAQSIQFAQQQAAPGVDSAASRFGAYGGSDWQNLKGVTNANIATNMGENAYNQGLNQQTQAMAMAPALNAAGGSNISLLNQLGSQQQNYPWAQLQQYMGILNNGSQGGTQTTPYFGPSPLAMGIGGGMGLAGIYSLLSDERLKKDIEPLSDNLEKVLQLKPVTYKWKDADIRGTQTEIGFIAQEVKEIVPEVVGILDNEGHLGIDYPKLTALLVGAVKELETRLDILEKKGDE
jgi:hypothetical protein